ncbi:MAG: imidazole glycerol phosphate synthase subunit HisH, partial [Thaumarchaeota archaeon]|nr:imidazole glycerol phosphate synthase subunit HisH [Nitrososphaerota archaeon]
MQITILDYGVGNLYSLRKALERRNVQPQVSKELPEKKELQGLILPGVGSFPAAAKKLSTLRQRIIDLADAGTPILGVCLGMQLFFEGSEEGQGKGLSLIPGEV